MVGKNCITKKIIRASTRNFGTYGIAHPEPLLHAYKVDVDKDKTLDL